MAQIQGYKAPADNNGQIFQVGGAVVGAAAGGLPGAAVGSGLGGLAGGMLNQAPPQTQMIQGPQESSDSFGRRMAEIDNSPQSKIYDSLNALQYVQDPQLRAQLAEPLLKADYIQRNSQS